MEEFLHQVPPYRPWPGGVGGHHPLPLLLSIITNIFRCPPHQQNHQTLLNNLIIMGFCHLQSKFCVYRLFCVHFFEFSIAQVNAIQTFILSSIKLHSLPCSLLQYYLIIMSSLHQRSIITVICIICMKDYKPLLCVLHPLHVHALCIRLKNIII